MSEPHTPRVGRQREPWEDDPAHQALLQWLYAWRQARPDRRLPGWAFAAHLGGEAIGEMRQGLRKVELMRLFWRLGDSGVCMCGVSWDGPVPAESVAEEAS